MHVKSESRHFVKLEKSSNIDNTTCVLGLGFVFFVFVCDFFFFFSCSLSDDNAAVEEIVSFSIVLLPVGCTTNY